jgi:hypothetical protein
MMKFSTNVMPFKILSKYAILTKMFGGFQLLEEDCFLDLEFQEAMPHLKRLGDTGLSNDQVLHAIKCWLVAAIDERQVYGSRVGDT